MKRSTYIKQLAMSLLFVAAACSQNPLLQAEYAGSIDDSVSSEAVTEEVTSVELNN